MIHLKYFAKGLWQFLQLLGVIILSAIITWPLSLLPPWAILTLLALIFIAGIYAMGRIFNND